MARPRTYTFRGSDSARVRALAKTPRRPKFALGEVVLDAFGDIGAIDAIYADMRAVEDSGQITDVDEWLKRLAVKPRTPKTGIWYSIAYGEGQGIAGELDLRRAPDGAASKP